MYKDNTAQILSAIEGYLREGAAAHAAVLAVLIGHVEETLPIAASAYRARLIEAESEAAFEAAHSHWYCCE